MSKSLSSSALNYSAESSISSLTVNNSASILSSEAVFLLIVCLDKSSILLTVIRLSALYTRSTSRRFYIVSGKAINKMKKISSNNFLPISFSIP